MNIMMLSGFCMDFHVAKHSSTDAEVSDGHSPVIGAANSLEFFQHPCSVLRQWVLSHADNLEL